MCICLLFGIALRAQNEQRQHYYVYIQSEKGQPFYVKHNGQVLSSSERGYLILPKLSNGTTPITVGFPKNEAPEQHFDLKVGAKDQGFLLKKATANAYTLYNLQTFRELKSDNLLLAAGETRQEAEQEVAEVTDTAKETLTKMQGDLESALGSSATITGPKKPAKNGNSFASALDKVVVSGDDREEVVEEAPAPPKATVKKPMKEVQEKLERAPLTDEEKAILAQVMAEESRTAASEAAAADVAKAADAAEERRNRHKRKKENSPDFIDFQEEGKPAAAATAPAEVPAAVEEPSTPRKKRRKEEKEVRTGEIVTDTSGYGVAIYEQSEETAAKKKRRRNATADDATPVAAADATEAAAAPVSSPKRKKRTETIAENEEDKPAASKRLINTDCGNIMDDGTFKKLLRKFVSSSTDDGMLDVFRRQTRNYCMETAQVKTLAQLVVGEDARYRLLDMAYSKTYDTEKYGSLESVLTDNYYKGRFKAMLHK